MILLIRTSLRRAYNFTVLKLVSVFYPSDDIRTFHNEFNISINSLLSMFILQKIIGFNRSVPWPVHFTSTVTSHNNINRFPGRSAPGFSPGCYIQAINGIECGDRVFIAPGVKIISANHDLIDLRSHVACPPIIIENDCWIGANSVILPGVHLGPGTVVAAGSIVTKSVVSGNCVIAGNPAKVIRHFNIPPRFNADTQNQAIPVQR